MGDQGSSSGDDYDQKNVIKGGTIKAGGDFRLGDDVIEGNQNVQVVHNYYSGSKDKGFLPYPDANLKAELKDLLGNAKTKEVIDCLLALCKIGDEEIENQVTLLQNRLKHLNNEERKNTLSNAGGRH